MANSLDYVTEDQRDDNGNPLKRVYIYKDDPRPVGDADVPYSDNKLTQSVAPEQKPFDLMEGLQQLRDMVAQYGTGILDQIGVAGMEPGPKRDAAKTGRNSMVGVGSDENLMWPQRMVKSGLTLPGDVASGEVPVVDPNTGHTSSEVIQRAQDTAGLAVPGALTQEAGTATLGSGPVRPGASAVAAETAPVFYSALEHAATNAAQDTMSPQQWLGFLKNQPGVKQEELAWTGLPEWLAGQKGKIRKEDVQAYLDEHKVEIKDVTKAGKNADDTVTDDLHDQGIQAVLDAFLDQNPRFVGREHTPAFERAHERFAEGPEGEAIYNRVLEGGFEPEGATRYSGYQLPGGENYREHLLTLPYRGPETTGGVLKLGANNPNYKSSHWDEPNVLAHVRTNDRDVGGKKSLHIEEIQSDWHQQGRKQGYQEPGWKERFNKLSGEVQSARLALSKEASRLTKDTTAYHSWQDYVASEPDKAKRDATMQELKTTQSHDKEYLAAEQRSRDAEAALKGANQVGRLPDAPFKTTWPELALKRMIRHAAENGYDRISWTPGEAQAARYDLSKTLDRVMYHADKQRLVATDKSGGAVLDKTVAPKKLADYIGKEAADKLLKAKQMEGVPVHVLENADLKVGGEGMREFYDKMLPKMAEKIGKAHGVKVKKAQLPAEQTKLEIIPHRTRNEDGSVHTVWQVHDDSGVLRHASPNKADAEAFAKKDISGQPVHYFDLPQSLKDHAIGKGFPLYMSGIPFPLTPVDHDPFKKERK